jgi:exonuclease III
MESHSRDDGEAPGSLLTILSFNLHLMSDFAGLPHLLRKHRPHLAFVQEITPHTSIVEAAAAAGYSTFLSTSLSRPKRTIAVLSHVPVQVSSPSPGYSQLLSLGDLSFLHLYLPAGNGGNPGVHARAALLRDIRPLLQRDVPPILVGDFNCIVSQLDSEDQDFVRNRKFSPELASIMSDFAYIDAFRVLFPVRVQFSWHARGKHSSRLDRVYLPPLLESRPRVALYIPSPSDHHAFLLRLETVGIAALPPPPPLAGASTES